MADCFIIVTVNPYIELTLFSEYYNKYSGEPEIMRDVDSAQKRNLSLNVTYLTPPQARTYTIGLSVNF